MTGADELLEDVAAAILDGTPIDWDSLESKVHEPDQSMLARLKLLATVRNVHQPAPPVSHEVLDHWGPLRIVEPLGHGAFGEVYRAWDTRLDREVALKLLPIDSRVVDEQRSSIIEDDAQHSSIIEEGRLLARVRHPNVVTIHGAERIGDRIGLWMELVNGRTLEQLLGEGRVFTASEVVGLSLDLCHAVSAVHKAGLLHRDIKAQNVMMANDGRVVLMDFGAGRELSAKSGALAGTPLYLAPEVLNKRDATIQSDVYSLGVLLYHLLTNAYPVRGADLHGLREAHQRGESTPLASARPDLPTSLARVIDRAIAREPELRYASADALAADLASLQPRSRLAYWAAAVIAASIVCLAWSAWEIRGWQVSRQSPTRAALAAWLPAGLAPAPVSDPVIAVMPFENLSDQPDSGYFADGLTDEVIQSLVGIDGLEVKSRLSSFAFKGKPRNVEEVGQQLGVNLILESSVLRAGNRVRVNSRLIQVAGDVPLWSDRFERDNTVKDMIAIQDEIASAIVNKLRLKLGTGQRRYDTNIDTYNLYLEARAMVGKHGLEGPRAAAELFRQVIAMDPAFAPAYAGLADAYAWMSHTSLEAGVAESALPVMQDAAEQALELDQLLAEGHAAMGYVYSRRLDWNNAQKSFRRAIDLNPSLTQSYTNYSLSTLVPLGKLDEAERLLRVAVQMDPLSPHVHRALGAIALNDERFDETIDHVTRARSLDPDLPFLDQLLGRALNFSGRTSEALELWKGSSNQPGGQGWLSHAYVRAGRRAEVEHFAATLVEPYRQALAYAALGDKDRTFEALNKAVEIVPHRVAPLLMYPEMRLLRGDPRLDALRKKLNLP